MRPPKVVSGELVPFAIEIGSKLAKEDERKGHGEQPGYTKQGLPM
jgi:hypothetical protein